MKKIITILNVKNESDIIESTCRYNLTYCDGMIIIDNGSSDNTKEIINKLAAEGLPIYLCEDFDTAEKRAKYVFLKNIMAHHAIDEYGADLVLPIDADEFLYHVDGINPREALEAMREDVEYRALWRMYVYEKEPDIALGFMPNNFTRYRNKEVEGDVRYYGKAIASRYLLKEKQLNLSPSAHWLEYPDAYKDDAKIEIHGKLVLAHFPVRSHAQMMISKIPRWISAWKSWPCLAIENREVFDAYGHGEIYYEFMNMGELAPDSIKRCSADYHMLVREHDDTSKSIRSRAMTKEEREKLRNESNAELTIYDPMNVSFCSDKLSLCYTDYNDPAFSKYFLRTLLKEIDATLTKISRELYELRQWTEQLQEGKDWLEGQYLNYKALYEKAAAGE